MGNYEQLISRISNVVGVSVEEIERKIDAKRARLSGLVSKEGAAQIVAAELGINFDNERLKIAELVHGMRRANIIGKILEIFPVREFNKNGREGRVCNLLVADESSNIRAVLWDSHHIDLISDGKLAKDDIIEISNASVRNGELHLGSFSDIKKSKEVLQDVVVNRVFNEKKIRDVKQGESFKVKAFIVQVFEPKYFEVCPKCGKKIVNGECIGEHGKIEGKKRALLSVVLDDGTETMRGVLFFEQISKLGLNDEDIFSLEKFAIKKNELLGEEKFFSGNVRTNVFNNNFELTIEDILDVEPQELVKELEAKL